MIEGMDIVGTTSLGEMAALLREPERICPYRPGKEQAAEETYPVDYREVNGQQVLKRAAEVAAAGMHGLLLNGRAGTGKNYGGQAAPHNSSQPDQGGGY